jgi:hypothetical protein
VPLPLDALREVTTLVTHDNCSDGLASAMLVKDAMPHHVEIVFVSYGTPAYLNLKAESGMLFCDIAPPEARAQEFVDAGALVLDHHKTQRHIVEMFGERGVFGDETRDPGVSGAMLAFLEVWLPMNGGPAMSLNIIKGVRRVRESYRKAGIDTSKDSPPMVEEPGRPSYAFPMALLESPKGQRVYHFARLAGVRDTWQKNDPLWDEALVQHSMLAFFPKHMWLTDNVFPEDEAWWQERRMVGRLVNEQRLDRAKKAIEAGYRFSVSGINVLVFQGISETSDAMEMVKDEVDLLIGFRYSVVSDKGPALQLSFRSNDNFDASAFAKATGLGGGGHTKAAGTNLNVSVDDENPYTFIRNLVELYVYAKP